MVAAVGVANFSAADWVGTAAEGLEGGWAIAWEEGSAAKPAEVGFKRMSVRCMISFWKAFAFKQGCIRTLAAAAAGAVVVAVAMAAG